MRKVVLYQLLSLDGVAEEPSDWFTEIEQDVFDNLARVIDTQDTVVMGRGTYDDWAGYWPTSDVEPFASFINNTDKHVFSSGPPDDRWRNTTFVTDPLVEYATKLKARPGNDIGIHGSIRLAQALWRQRLIDELELVIAPTVAGHGRRLFDHRNGELQRLRLLDIRRSPQGTLFVSYRLPPTT